jgi:hypothetical protein
MKNVEEITRTNPAMIKRTIITFIPKPVKLLQTGTSNLPF